MVAKVNAEDCVACGLCVDACPQEAIKVDDVAVIDPELCIDCGVCVDECPQGALSVE